MDLDLIAIDAVRLTVEHDVADLEHARQDFGLRPPQECTNAGDEFGRGERFDEIVVGAGRKPAHPVAFLAARRQHDDRQALGFSPHAQPAAKLDAGDGRHHPVEDEQIRHGFLEPDFRFVAARDHLDLVALGFQIVLDQDAQRLLVLDHHDPRRVHRLLLTPAWPRSTSRRASAGGAAIAGRPSHSRRSPRCWSHDRRSAPDSWRRKGDGCRR